MLFFTNDHSGIGCMHPYWMPVMHLKHPEVRDSKFIQHARPGAYVGPSREVESDAFCWVWDGSRHISIHLGCMRGDDRQVIAKSSRTNGEMQPFAIKPDRGSTRALYSLARLFSELILQVLEVQLIVS